MSKRSSFINDIAKVNKTIIHQCVIKLVEKNIPSILESQGYRYWAGKKTEDPNV